MSSASAAAWAAAKPFSAMPGPRALPFGTLPRYFLPGWLQGEERYSFDRLHHKGEWLQRRFGGGEGGAVREDIVPGAPIVWLYSPGDIAEMFASEGKCPSRRYRWSDSMVATSATGAPVPTKTATVTSAVVVDAFALPTRAAPIAAAAARSADTVAAAVGAAAAIGAALVVANASAPTTTTTTIADTATTLFLLFCW